MRQRQLAAARRRQRRQQLGVDQAIDQRRRRGEKADAPVRRQDLGEARDVDRALERVERGQARRVRRREVRVGVVLDDVQAELARQLQHAVRRLQAERGAGRVVQHRDGDVEARPRRRRLRLDQPPHRRDVGPALAARHRQHAHAERGQARVLDRPAGLVDEDAVAGAQQRPGDDVERLGRADGGRRSGWARRRCRSRRAWSRAPRAGAARRRDRRSAGPPRRLRGLAAARRIAAASIGASSHSAGSVPRPGIERLPGAWNMPRISAVALFGSGRTGAAAAAAAGAAAARLGAAHEEAALPARLDQALRLQLVVGGDHRVRAHRVAARALAHRRQAGAGRQQALARCARRSGASAARRASCRSGARAQSSHRPARVRWRARRAVPAAPPIQRIASFAEVYRRCAGRRSLHSNAAKPGDAMSDTADPNEPQRGSPRARARPARRRHLRHDRADDAPRGRPGARSAAAAAVRDRRPRRLRRPAELPSISPRHARRGRTRHQLRGLLVSALGTVVGFPLFLALALRHVDAMHAAVVTGVLPLATAIAAALAWRQRPSPGFWLCAVLGCRAGRRLRGLEGQRPARRCRRPAARSRSPAPRSATSPARGSRRRWRPSASSAGCSSSACR